MTLRYGVAVPQAGPFASLEVQRSLARSIEDLGYDSLWVSDHVIVPVGERYIPEVMLEPLALLAWLASATTSITLGTSVLILPYRDPVFTAKFVASVDELSAGRIVLGVGAGWHEREFETLSASFADRGAVTDEWLRVIRNLWETETSSFSGRWKSYTDMRLFPKGHGDHRVPILVGGNARPSVRRAGELGDGWHPINLSPAQLVVGVASYREACARFDRAAGPVVLRHMPGGRTTPEGRPPLSGTPAEQAEDLRAYEAAGLDELMLSLSVRTPDELVPALASFREDVVPLV
ncbi:MAG TPA: TIGR03619 family F420-dependent LLM class oxidoreductase [Acidimicrobiales bacterium]|nr:TIGR03619 family F420-dependent LLM class oxidoreductase [Acidimicrobiales bacterium]